ncbi:MAG: squalene/phytoene synthase family protein [Phycisphaerales bacterium]
MSTLVLDTSATAAIDAFSLASPPSGLVPPPRGCSAEVAKEYVRSLALNFKENFSVLTGLVPDTFVPHFAAVYAFCRWSDDLADETGAGDAARQRSLLLLDAWGQELEACAAGEASHPVFVALAESIRERDLPVEAFFDLLDAFRQDQVVTRYQTLQEVEDYSTRSANPVGRLVLAIAGVRGPGCVLHASDCTCTALQLINFWQDVARDLLERDRVYLPLSQIGLSFDDLARVVRGGQGFAPGAYEAAVAPLLQRTQDLFDAGDQLIPMLEAGPGRDVIGPVRLFAAGGKRVLALVRRAGSDVLRRRPKISAPARLALLVREHIRLAMEDA